MHIKKVEIKNFRLLESVDLFFEERTTVIVGRNNSGKTSLAELFRRLLLEGPSSFKLEDFSLGVHEQFWNAFVMFTKHGTEDEIRGLLPVIEVNITISYTDADNLGLLNGIIIDINQSCFEALIKMRYQLEAGKIETFFNEIELTETDSEDKKKSDFFKKIKERIFDCYKTDLSALDPNDLSNTSSLEWTKLRALIKSGFINAQRELDDKTDKEKDVLGKILESLFTTAMSDSADENDKRSAKELEDSVIEMQGEIDVNFNTQMKQLIPALDLFGYPGLSDPKLRTETTLDVTRLLKDHTRIRYTGINGVHLPETYNGLGARNLIFILLKLLEFFKSYQATQPAPGIHLVFIEEPEAHLHPQMQEVFISKLSDIAKVFADAFNNGNPWPVQFIVSTHSSHMANRAPFKTIRYFLTTNKPGFDQVCIAKIKDLGSGFSGTLKDHEDFLHQYMTLTRCDLLFADKAILIEGTSERILMMKMVEKIDSSQSLTNLKISSQYVSVMEVGGAFAHKFFGLIDFLELKTLIITDLDSVNNNRKACKVSEGIKTSNACIKTWFNTPDITPALLIAKSSADKIKNIQRISYQVPENSNDPCGRSFEDAFILANPTLFNLTSTTVETKEDEAWTMAMDLKKSEFALTHAIQITNWIVPRYIKEGLEWLASNHVQPVNTTLNTPTIPPIGAGPGTLGAPHA